MLLTIQNVYSYVIKSQRFNLLLLTYIPDEYNKESHYYPFPVKLDKCIRSCNTLNDLFNKVYVPNKTGNLNIYFLI